MRTLTFLVALTIGGVAGAQTTHDHMTMPGMSGMSSMSPLDLAHFGDLETLSGPTFERAYLSMMIEHHRLALDMTRAALPRLKDPQVKKWAEQVLLAQGSEITEMTAQLRDFNLGSLDKGRQATMRAAMGGMLEAMNTPNPDEAWVTNMLAHHAMGVTMATLAILRADDDRVRQEAAGIARAQAQQMYEYRRWTPGS